MSRHRTLAIVAVSLWAAGAHACCPDGSATGAFLAPGPFGVGVRTLTLVDTTRVTPAHGAVPEQPQRTLPTEVWYPAAAASGAPMRDAPLVPGGPFPLVVNSPGYLDYREGEQYYMAALASRGYVVASLDFPLTGLRTQGQHDLGDVHNQPGDVRFVIDSLLALSRTPDAWLAGGVRRHRIGASGLSLGGLTTLLVTYHPTLRDRRIRAALPIAPSACFLGERFYHRARRPVLVVQGDQDLIVPLESNGALVYQRSPSPRELVTLIAGTHTAFAGAVTYPSPTSYDTLGCAAIQGAGLSGDPTAGLGGAEAGIDASACALPC